jgi:hypothetical protein
MKYILVIVFIRNTIKGILLVQERQLPPFTCQALSTFTSVGDYGTVFYKNI